ncbi:6-pyruvoyl-tetrahydropterin synthase-related protein [Dysgonomonas termitidis]
MIVLYIPFAPGHDFYFHCGRLQALIDNLGSPFLIYLDYDGANGYGYFTKAFYPDVMLIPFAILGKFIPLIYVYLIMLFSITVLCGISSYLFVNYLFKDSFAAAVSSLLYTFSVYRIINLYERAALGESISLSLIPFVLLGLCLIIKGDYKKWYVLAIAYSLLIFTHLISSVLMFVTAVILLAVNYKSLVKEPKRLGYLVLAGIVTIVITSYYLFPMLEQMASDTFYFEDKSRRIVGITDMTFNFSYVLRSVISYPKDIYANLHTWHFFPPIGILLIMPVLLRFFVRNKSGQLKYADIGVIIGLIYITPNLNVFPWDVFPFRLLDFIQFPWRLFGFSSLFFAIASGYYLSQILRTTRKQLIGSIVVFVTFVFIYTIIDNDAYSYSERRGYKYTIGKDTPLREQLQQYSKKDSLLVYWRVAGGEYFPTKLPGFDYIWSRGDTVKSKNAATSISGFSKNKGITSLDVDVYIPDSLELPLVYYKGYAAEMDGKRLPVSESSKGLVQIPVDKQGHVKVWYNGTIIQRISYCVSIISIIILCLYIFRDFFRKKCKRCIKSLPLFHSDAV